MLKLLFYYIKLSIFIVLIDIIIYINIKSFTFCQNNVNVVMERIVFWLKKWEMLQLLIN